MLQAIRKRQKFLLTVFITLISVVFVFWGFYGGGLTQLSRSDVASVNGEAITLSEFQRQYQNTVRVYRNILKDKFTPETESRFNLRQLTLNQLIDQKLITLGADALGIVVTDQEVREQIVGSPYFKKNDQFDEDLYREILRINHLTPAVYEQNLRLDILQRKVADVLRNHLKVTPHEALQDYRLSHDKANIAFVRVRPKDLTPAVQITPDEMKAFAEKKENIEAAQNRYTQNNQLYLPKTFQEARGEILKQQLTDQKQEGFAKSVVEELWKFRTSGIKFNAILKRHKLKWEETGIFSRSARYLPKIGEADDIRKAAFTLKEKKAFAKRYFKLDNDFFIIRIKQRESADLKKFDKTKDQLIQRALAQKQNAAFSQWLEEIRNSAKINIRRDVIEPEN